MTSESDDNELERIKAGIRADADAARQRAPLPERSSIVRLDITAQDGAEQASIPSIASIARHNGPAFVESAYLAILHRSPDPDGLARQMAALAAGANKIEVIGDLRYSAEGRRTATPIPGLFPRYALAKLGRMPVLGTIVQWLLALVALPHMLRHQRATEASLAVRFGEAAARLDHASARLQAAEQRETELRETTDGLRADLAGAVDELSARLTRAEVAAHQLRVYIEGVNANVAELRQLALTMNHWTVQVRHSIDAIETAEAERRARRDEAAGAAILDARSRDGERAMRLAAWADELAQRLPRGGTVLDLGIGADWLAALVSRGFDASAIEANPALHREARARGLNVTLGSAEALLARVADASLDAITLAFEPHGAKPGAELLAEAHRVLKRGGCILVAIAQSRGSAEAAVADVVASAGFGDAERSDAFAGQALLAVRA